MAENLAVPMETMQAIDRHYAGMTLNVHHPERSTAKVVELRSKTWVCTGTLSSGVAGLLEVYLQRVVPQYLYQGPPHDPKSNQEFYLGSTFRCRGRWWVFERERLTLIPDGSSQPRQLTLLE